MCQWVNLDTNEKEITYITAPFYDGTYQDLGIAFYVRPYVTDTEFKVEAYIANGSSATYELNYYFKIIYDPEGDL
jgi:hypothetical protein